MRIVWDDLNARARGLDARRLAPAVLEAMEHAPDLEVLRTALVRHGWTAGEAHASASDLEGVLRRGAAERLRLLSRWAGRRVEALAVLYGDEDRRSLRALLRGAVAGVPAAARLAGLIPTPSLPGPWLEILAKLSTPAEMASQLVERGHPWGAALRAEASTAHPSLCALEHAINVEFARRALSAARRGGAELRDYVRLVIDLDNAWSALLLAEQGGDLDPARFWVAGGMRLGRTAFEAAAAAGVSAARARLAALFEGTRLGEAWRTEGDVERAVLEGLIAEVLRAARLNPLSAAVVVLFALRLRIECIRLWGAAWSIGLQVPVLVRWRPR